MRSSASLFEGWCGDAPSQAARDLSWCEVARSKQDTQDKNGSELAHDGVILGLGEE